MRFISFKQFVREEAILLEDRMDFIKGKYEKQGVNTDHDEHAEHKEPAAIVSHLAQHADPTSKKTYTDWITDKYSKGQFKQEDTDNVHRSLQHFEKHKAKLEKKDINQYKTLSDLDDAVRPHIGTASTKKEKEEHIKTAGLEKLADNGKTQVYHVKSKEASQQVYGGGSERGGTGTNWCTAARSSNCLYDSYHSRGNLYTFHIDGDKKSPYQMHMSPEGKIMETMDRHNHQASAGDLVHHIPEIRGHPEFAGKHPIFDKPEEVSKKIEKYDNPGYVHEAVKGGVKLTPQQSLHVASKAIEHGGQEHKQVLNALIGREDTPSKTIEHLAHHATTSSPAESGRVWGTDSTYHLTSLARHPNITDKAAHDLMHAKVDNLGDTNRLRVTLSNNKNSSGETLSKIHKMNISQREPSHSVGEALSANPSTPSHVLDHMANNSTNHIEKTNALMHSSTSPDVLMKHVDDKSSHAALSTNTNTPSEGLRKIFDASKEKTHIHENLAKNTNTPKDILQVLSEHPDKGIAKSAARSLKGKK